MRAIIIIIIIALIAIIVPPYWFGMKAEEEYNNLIETVSKYENLEIISRSYKRGWLKSSGEIKYSVKDEDKNHLKIIQRDTIYHGPIPIGTLSTDKITLKPVMAIIETDADIKTDSKEKYAEFINSLPQANFETTLSLSGYGTTEVSIPAVDNKLKSGTSLNWSGLDGLINFTPDLHKASSVFNFSELEIEDEKALISVSGLNLESNLDYPASNFKNPLGDMSVKIEEISSEGREGEDPNKVTISNFEITASTNQTGNLLNHTHSAGIGQISVGGNSYGPGIYEFEIRNIDKTAFEEIQMAIKENQADENQDTVTLSDLLTAQIMKTLPSLLKNSPEIELTKLSVKTGEGEINGHAIIAASGDSLDNPELAANPIFLLAALSAEMNFSVSKPLFDNLLKDYKIEEITDEMNNNEKLPSDKELQTLGQERAQAEIKEMLDQKILILNNGKYEIEATYGVGRVTLNGNPLDLGALINQL